MYNCTTYILEKVRKSSAYNITKRNFIEEDEEEKKEIQTYIEVESSLLFNFIRIWRRDQSTYFILKQMQIFQHYISQCQVWTGSET